MARPVRFNIHPIEAKSSDAVASIEAPEGYAGEGFFTSKLSDVVGLARKNSLWPLPFATSCCGYRIHGNHGVSLRPGPVWL